jgi:NADH-quinone oxidoreductase subunit A
MLGLFLLVGLIIPIGAIGAAWVLAPKKPNPIKQTTYECGIETVGDSWVQFKAQYYIFALVFLIFDVETVFLFPWAVKLNSLGMFAVARRHPLHPHPHRRLGVHMAQRDAGVGVISIGSMEKAELV